MIEHKDISIVFQGKFPTESSHEYQECVANIARVRCAFPGSPIFLGTWEGRDVAQNLGFDRVVFSKDPGPLPSFKKNAPNFDNNVNRQILGSASVLKQVSTRYTLKMRLDCALQHTRFLDFYAKYGKTSTGEERIAVSCFYTVDPRMYEQMPFHISDWCAFGPTTKLRQLWNVPLMNLDDATYYDRYAAAPYSSYFDKLFRSRLAIEQHIAIHYARRLGYETPSFHNDVSAGILRSHDKFVARELLILNVDQYGIICGKYAHTLRSSFQHMNCLMFLDWYLLNANDDRKCNIDPTIYRAAVKRARLKNLMRMASTLTNPAMPLIRQRYIKGIVSKALRVAMRLN